MKSFNLKTKLEIENKKYKSAKSKKIKKKMVLH